MPSFGVIIANKKLKCNSIAYCDGGIIYCYKYNGTCIYVKFVSNKLYVYSKDIEFIKIKLVFIKYIISTKNSKFLSKSKDIKCVTRYYSVIGGFKCTNILFCKISKSKSVVIMPTMQSVMQFRKNAYILEYINSDSSNKILSNFSKISLNHFNVSTNNKKLNYLINNVLPNKICSKFDTVDVIQKFLQFNIRSEYNFNYICNLMYKQKQYIHLYLYLLKNYLGVFPASDGVVFTKNYIYSSKFLVEFGNDKFLVCSSNCGRSVLHNGVMYNNINFIKSSKNPKQN